MPKQILAVALCRVSSIEQLESNSLDHQKGNVLKAAKELSAIIPDDAVWEGAVSSKKGVNFNRKDLKEIYEYCKSHAAVRYVIVQEVDRFMRSPDEQTYFYVKFWYELRVRIWFADKPELNEDTHVASLLRYMEGWRAAGSNEERQNKSINGQTAALKEGRYPFAPKPGYKHGYEKGIQEIHTVRGPALRTVLIRLASKIVTPSQALIELNNSKFMVGHSPYRMDKFRNIVTDPFYAGIVEINKQVHVRNEHGLHEPLITKAQHLELIKIMDNKKKAQSGPHKNGNPKYPISNLATCDKCLEKTNCRYVGFDHGNGKSNSKLIYEKYRCRACGRYMTRNELHSKVEGQFKDNPITSEAQDELIKALKIVWKQREGQAEQETIRIKHVISNLRRSINDQVEAATDPDNVAIKQEILDAIDRKKQNIVDLENKLEDLNNSTNDDWERFLRYAYSYIEDIGAKFLDESTSQENRLRCKQIVFPAGFHVDERNKVYTPEKSLLITLLPTKKDALAPDFSHLVRVRGL
ncbi:MAG TPA: recombinase family protein [Candidatus Dormibacteraeota bacterium]|nr:recombinase family protein [Candidatus Dormibacteraeota bacterium]